MAGFRYAKKRLPKPIIGIIKPKPRPADAEALTGFINGIPTDSEPEERFFYSAWASKNVIGVFYKLQDLVAPYGTPGWKELDFLVQMSSGNYRAFQLADFSFIHHGAAAISSDFLNDILLIKGLRNNNIFVEKIEWVDSETLDTQENSDLRIKELLE